MKISYRIIGEVEAEVPDDSDLRQMADALTTDELPLKARVAVAGAIAADAASNRPELLRLNLVVEQAA